MRYACGVPTWPSAVDSMLPHEVAGGCTPNPRNERLDSVMIAAATASVALTMIGPMMFGRMWRPMMRKLDAPEARAAPTNSFSRIDSTWALTTRAVDIQNTAASTKDMTHCVPP